MKKIFFIALFCFIAGIASAQNAIPETTSKSILWWSVSLMVAGIFVLFAIYGKPKKQQKQQHQSEHSGDEYDDFHSTYP